MKKIFLIITIFCLFLASFQLQNFFTSMTKIEYTENSKTLKCATKIDIEQIEKVLGAKLNTPNFELNLKTYIYNNIEISINNQVIQYNYTGKQESGQLLWIYYEVKNVSFVKSIGIRNSILINKNPNQQNFISFLINNKKGSFVCIKGKEYGNQNF